MIIFFSVIKMIIRNIIEPLSVLFFFYLKNVVGSRGKKKKNWRSTL